MPRVRGRGTATEHRALDGKCPMREVAWFAVLPAETEMPVSRPSPSTRKGLSSLLIWATNSDLGHEQRYGLWGLMMGLADDILDLEPVANPRYALSISDHHRPRRESRRTAMGLANGWPVSRTTQQ